MKLYKYVGENKILSFFTGPWHTVAMAKLFESIGKLGLALAIGGGVVNSALYNGKEVKGLKYRVL